MPPQKKRSSTRSSKKATSEASPPLDVPAERILALSNRGIFDLSGKNPDYLTDFLQGAFLSSDHDFVTLQNRKTTITDRDREIMYARNGAARLIVDDPALFTWTQGVTSPDAKVAKVLARAFRVLRRPLPIADIHNRLYGAGPLILGFNDGGALSRPLGKATDLKWAHAVSRKHVREVVYDRDTSSPRYGQPKLYVIWKSKPGTQEGQTEQIIVHASRVLMLTERPHVHPIFGGSQLDPAWNDLEDAGSIGWASAESFYSGANPKFILKTQRPLTSAQETAVDNQLAGVRSNLRHVLKMLQSMDLQALTKGSDLARPLEHVVTNAVYLAQSSGIPFSRFFKYHLTSGEALDWALREWYEYIGSRQHTFGNVVLDDLLDRFATAGMISEEEAQETVKWNPPRVLTREDYARIVRNEAVALASAFAQTGYVPKDAVEHYVPAPSRMQVQKALEGTTGERDVQEEAQSQASTKNQGRRRSESE